VRVGWQELRRAGFGSPWAVMVDAVHDRNRDMALPQVDRLVKHPVQIPMEMKGRQTGVVGGNEDPRNHCQKGFVGRKERAVAGDVYHVKSGGAAEGRAPGGVGDCAVVSGVIHGVDDAQAVGLLFVVATQNPTAPAPRHVGPPSLEMNLSNPSEGGVNDGN
jgi:hypothetical protein